MSGIGTGPKRLCVIHHSHTDIGYTELQSTIERWQVDFIRQALDIIGDDCSPGFKWTCETFRPVELFWAEASRAERDRFKRALHDGRIGLSGNYLNLNELRDFRGLKLMSRRAADFGREVGSSVECAMTADINGFGWGFSQALYDEGIENLFTCIHTHHGMYPMGKRHVAFWWETPGGDKILVFNGEHYHYGNELGLVPGAVSSYIIKDECDAAMIFSDHWRVAEIRIPRFLEQLRQADYPFDSVAVMASGLRTDNAPPNAAIAASIDRWNSEYGDVCAIEMITLSEFFKHLRRQADDLPVYRGDWPDWWSDGPASYPNGTRLFRQAQRELRQHEGLTMAYQGIQEIPSPRVEELLTLYAEHTFSHADSVSQPWHFMTHAISTRKQAYASEAHERIQGLLARGLKRLGATTLKAGMPLVYRVLNPFPRTVRDFVKLVVGHFEYHELRLDRGACAILRNSETIVPHQIEPTPGGTAFVVEVEIEPGATVDIEIVPDEQHPVVASNFPEPSEPPFLETPFLRLSLAPEVGIVSWSDVPSGRDLLASDRLYAPFTPIREITPVEDPSGICGVRGEMQLNRKGRHVERHVGVPRGISKVETGPLSNLVHMTFELPGAEYCQVSLNAYHTAARVDVTLKMAKENRWAPENVYLALPFALESDRAEFWLDKAGARVRPRIDQLPGTLIDFYSIQEGLAMVEGDFGLVVATPDSSLVHLGDLEYRPRRLHDPDRPEPNLDHTFAWLMTNFWETNFGAGLGGFYEFRFSVLWGPAFSRVEAALDRCAEVNTGLCSFRLGEKRRAR